MKHEEVPDDWIPVNDHMEYNDDADMTGGTFLDPSGMSLNLIQVHKNGPNDVIKLYDTEVPRLIKKLMDYALD